MRDEAWATFNNKLIRVRDIDYFEFIDSERRIICMYHLGQKYEQDEEIPVDYEARVKNLITNFTRENILPYPSEEFPKVSEYENSM